MNEVIEYITEEIRTLEIKKCEVNAYYDGKIDELVQMLRKIRAEELE